MDKRMITPEDIPAIKKGYAQAVKDNADTFTVMMTDGEEAEFVTDYAKYVIAHFMNVKG
jgi:hypothetical protein